MPAATPLHAVCITGEERSFGEIGANVREGVLRMLGTPRVAFFGVKPVNDPWTGLQKLLPLTTVIAQHKCWDAEDLNVTVRWVHCDMRGRSDCRVSFIQTMCDLKACLRMVSSFESHNGMQFATITKLRPDVFWETAFDLPEVQANTVYVPGIDAARGVNDKLAVGGREAMRSYLSRYKKAEAGHRLAVGGNSCPSSRVYHPSEWEASWRERVGQVADNSVSWAAGCRQLRNETANVWHWLQLAQARSNGTVGLSASWDAAVVSHHRVISCDGALLARVPLEPLVSFLRHPLAVCWTKVSHLLAKEHLLVPWANEIFPGAARSFFFDVGASLYASGRTKGGYSQSWFANQYSTRGLAFDRVVAWEAANSTDQTILSQLPPAVRSATTIHREPPTLEQLLDSGNDSLTYHNFAVDAGPDSARNPLRVLEALTRPEDFVVLKIDIDAPSVERELVGQLLKQPTLQQRVDEFFWEHEVMGSPMVHRGWTIRKTDRGRPKETLANSYGQFRALREAGIRAHSWV